jgi:hypothetical protein
VIHVEMDGTLVWEPQQVDGDARAALGVVLAAFDRSGRPAFAHVAERPMEGEAGGALVVRCPGRRVLVLGD